MFRTVSLSIIGSLALYTQRYVYVIQRDQDVHPGPTSKQSA